MQDVARETPRETRSEEAQERGSSQVGRWATGKTKMEPWPPNYDRRLLDVPAPVPGLVHALTTEEEEREKSW